VLATADIFLFEGFRLDRQGDGLSRRNERGVFVPVPIGLRALDVLGALVERSGDLVSKEEIMGAVWGRTVVENANLTVQISALRRILDEQRTEGSCIQTVAARGYRFVAPVTRVEHTSASFAGSGQEDTGAMRRLIAILAADVAGYSRLMGEDEEGTLTRLKAHRRDLVDPKIAEYRGRIVKTTGDGLLVEFGSVVEAVRCAAEIQRAMLDRDRDIPEKQRVRFRIGVNLGDVIVDDGDIFGDGVNVAARLEGLAEPGGVCVAHTVRDQIHDKLPYAFADLGEQFVKNITRPVRAYVLSPEAIVGLPAATVSPTALPRPRRAARVLIAAAAVASLAIAAGAIWWARPAPRAPTASTPAAVSAPLMAPRLSIVVLPFANLSNDPDQQYFADGITEDLTTDLSRLPNMLVIARNTAFTYKNKPVDAKQIGRELGVRYLLEGSVQRSGNQVRVTTQLIDAETGTHLYAERFDRPVGDMFALQNDVTSRIAVALNLELVAAEAARPSDKPDVLEYILKGRAASARPPTRENRAEAVSLYEHAMAVDPSSIDAQSRLANGLIGRTLDGVTDSPAEDIKRAEGLLDSALVVSPGNPYLHYLKGQLLRAVAQGRFGLAAEARAANFADAIPEYELYLAANPNAVDVLAHLAWCKFMTGAENEAIPLLEKAIRLSPRDPGLYLWYTRLGQVHFFQGHLEEAILWLDKARRANPPFPFPHGMLAAAYGLKGDLVRAAAELGEFNETAKRRNDNRWGTIALARKNSDLNTPVLHDRFEQYLVTGLRKAGEPEE
jgi:TolB-like protein/class 3 adenylate cyclase